MTAIDPLVPVGEAADADVHSDLASLRRVWRLAGPLRGKVARGVVFRFLQSICLGLAFGGVISGATMVNYILVGYLWKVAVETLCLPITYRVIAAVKRREPTYAAAG